MTGATSTLAGGGPVDARTLLLLQPSELDNNAAPMNPAKIFFFIVRFLTNRVTGAQEPRHLLIYVRMRHEGSCRHLVTVLQIMYHLYRFKNMQKKSFDRDAARRRVILDAARDCILKFGYAKSSLEDIA